MTKIGVQSSLVANHRSSLAGLSGTTVGGKYKLNQPLGSGGMGYVYQAEQLGLGRSVAVKLVHRELLASRFEWFRAEALAASRINHPNAVAIYDFGITADGVPYLVMEHLRGTTLSELIGDRRIDIDRAGKLGAQILSALAEAHACGVIHCDLTGANVIVERLRDGTDLAKVIDFGLARIASTPVRARPIGTAEYTAPEQIRGEVISPKTDLYAVGVLLYEMIVGRTPFAGQSLDKLLDAHLTETPQRVDALVPSCPPRLAGLIHSALAKATADRPASALAMLEELQAIERGDKSAPTKPVKPRRATLRFGAPEPRDAPRPRPRRTSRIDLGAKATASVIGRDSEIAELEAFLGGSEPALQLVGPSGMGKSRLVTEAVQRAGARGRVFVASADPSGLRTSWYPILTALEAVFDNRRIDSEDDLRRAIARAGLRERELPGLAEVFAIPGPARTLEREVREREAFAAATRALTDIARRCKGAVLCFTDADRYDGPSMRVVEAIAETARGGGCRLLVTAGRYIRRLGGQTLELRGLSPKDAAKLVATLTGDKRRAEASAIEAITHGSPAAIEQLAGWLNMGLHVADAPSVLVDLISVRVNRLPADARRALQAIAVHGSVASREVLEVMLDAGEMGALAQIDTTGLAHRTRDSYVIPSRMAAEVIAACTPADVRRRLHFKSLEALGPDASFGVRAHHARHAGELGRALSLFLAAGDDAVRRFDDVGAARWYGQAVSTARDLQARGVPTADSDYVDAALTLAETLRRSGDDSLASGILTEIDSIIASERHRSMALRCAALIEAETDLDGAATKLGRAIAAALSAGDTELVAQTYLDLARVKISAGDMTGAESELEQVIELLTAGRDLSATSGPARLWRIGMTLCELQVNLGKLDEAKQTARATLAFAGRIGSARSRARSSALLALICDQTGDAEEALELRSEALRDLRGLGDRRSTAELLLRRVRGTGDQRAADVARALSEEIGWEDGVEQASELSKTSR